VTNQLIAGTESSEILIRFSTHELRAKNSIRFSAIIVHEMTGMETWFGSAHQSKVLWDNITTRREISLEFKLGLL
jgi:hypothetical protein